MFSVRIFLLVIFFLATRLFLYFYLGVHNAHSISYTWQLLDLDLLQNDLLESLLLLHSQPPLWNLFIGLLLKIFDGDQPNFYHFLYLYHLTLTLITIFIVNNIIIRNNVDRIKSFIFIFFFIILNPGIIYFESLNYYAHTIFFLSFLFFYNFYLFIRSLEYKYIFYCYIVILLKTLIWSAYHPIILILFYSLLFFAFKQTRKRINLLIFFLFLFLSYSPQLKNKIIYHSSLTSHFGFALATTVIPAATFPECSMGAITANPNANTRHFEEKFVQENKNRLNLNFKHPSIYGEKSKYNSIALIDMSRECSIKTLNFIRENPLSYIKNIIVEFFSIHGQLTIDLGNYIDQPSGWDFVQKMTLKIDKNSYYKLIRQLINFLFLSFVYVYFLFKLMNKKSFVSDKNFIVMLLLKYFYILIIGLFVSKYEGTRFIYAEYVFFVFFFIYILSKNNSLFLNKTA